MVLFITDIRHPVSGCSYIYNAICIVIVCPNLSVYKVLHFSPALFSHVTVDLKKQLVLVLNKVQF